MAVEWGEWIDDATNFQRHVRQNRHRVPPQTQILSRGKFWMRDDHFMWEQFSVVKGVDRWRALPSLTKTQGKGVQELSSPPALTLTVGCEFQAVGVTHHISLVLAESCVPHKLVIQHSPRRVLAGLGRREDGDDVGDFASIERRVDVPLQVVYGLRFGRAIPGVKDLKGAPKVPANASV